MNYLPPLDQVVDTFTNVVLPGMGVAYGISIPLCLLAWLLVRPRNWRVAFPFIALLATAATVYFVNDQTKSFPRVPDGKWWHWNGWAIAAAIVTEFAARVIPGRTWGFLLRGTIGGVIASFLVPAAWQAESKWWIPAVALWLTLSWAVIVELGRQQEGGSLSNAISILAGGSGLMLVYAGSLGLSNIATALSIATGCLAAVAWVSRSNADAAASAVVVPLLILIFLNRPIAESEVPVRCHFILGLTPLAMGVFLMPPLKRWQNTVKAGVMLHVFVLIPVAIAVITAAVMAPMQLEEEKW